MESLLASFVQQGHDNQCAGFRKAVLCNSRGRAENT